METKKVIGQRLKYLRENLLKLSQSELAKALGVKRTTLASWEQGKSEINYEIANKLLKQFRVNINWLLTGVGTPLINIPDKTEPKELDPLEQEVINILKKEPIENRKALLEFLKKIWASKPQSSSENASTEQKENTRTNKIF